MHGVVINENVAIGVCMIMPVSPKNIAQGLFDLDENHQPKSTAGGRD